MVVGFGVSAGLLDSADFGVWLFVVCGVELSAVGTAVSSISRVEVAVSADSVDVVGGSVDSSGSVVTTDSPAEKEDEGAGDSSLPGCVAFCEQPTIKTLKTAVINNMLVFLILSAPFCVPLYCELEKVQFYDKHSLFFFGW